MFLTLDCADTDWVFLAKEALEDVGIVILANAIPVDVQAELAEATERLKRAVELDMGPEYAQTNLAQNSRLELQVPLRYEAYFYKFLELEPTRQAVEAVLGQHGILRSQTFEDRQGRHEGLIQADWHMNFKVPGDGVDALDVIYVFEELSSETSCLEVVLGSHRRRSRPDDRYLATAARPLCCPAGSLVLMDARLWHRESAGVETTRHLFVHQLFVPHWVKPFFDFPRLLGESELAQRDQRVQTYLGVHSRPPISMQEFTLPASERPYRSGQWGV